MDYYDINLMNLDNKNLAKDFYKDMDKLGINTEDSKCYTDISIPKQIIPFALNINLLGELNGFKIIAETISKFEGKGE